MAQNPYAAPTAAQRNGTAPPHAMVFGGNQRYAVKDIPETTDPEYTLGYSPELRAGGSSTGEALPDDVRIGKRETPIPGRNWNDPRWQAKEDSEFLERHSVEDYEVRGPVQQRKAPTPNHPLWYQERLPIRPSATRSPAYATFQRPWHIPRNAKDALGEDAVTHLSLADHRRMYPISAAPQHGMRPMGRLGTNTYRPQPQPWDKDLFVPPKAGMETGAIAGNRAYRL